MDDIGGHPEIIQIDDLAGTESERFLDIKDIFTDHAFVESATGELHHIGHWAGQGRRNQNCHRSRGVYRGWRLGHRGRSGLRRRWRWG